jgi:hypothetical protein
VVIPDMTMADPSSTRPDGNSSQKPGRAVIDDTECSLLKKKAEWWRLRTMDENTRTQIFILVLGVLIGASGYLANSLFLWNTSVDKDRSDIAEGLYLDVSSLQDNLVATDLSLLANPGDKNIFVQATPIYPDNGLFFAYQRDIPKMNRKIAQDTFAFYHHLQSAERDRALIYDIQRQGDLRPLTSSELRRQQILTQNAAGEVNISLSLLPALKQELDTASG